MYLCTTWAYMHTNRHNWVLGVFLDNHQMDACHNWQWQVTWVTRLYRSKLKLHYNRNISAVTHYCSYTVLNQRPKSCCLHLLCLLLHIGTWKQLNVSIKTWIEFNPLSSVLNHMDMKYVTVPSAAVALGGLMIVCKCVLAACRLT